VDGSDAPRVWWVGSEVVARGQTAPSRRGRSRKLLLPELSVSDAVSMNTVTGAPTKL